jgi:hypothetical protein
MIEGGALVLPQGMRGRVLRCHPIREGVKKNLPKSGYYELWMAPSCKM